MDVFNAFLLRKVAEAMKPKTPKLEPVSENRASIKGDFVVQQLKMPKVEPGCKGDSVQEMPKLEPGCEGDSVAEQLKTPKLEPQRENNNSPKCVLGPNLINLSSSSASSSSDDEEDNESGGEDSEAASSDHSDRSDSDEEEYKVASDEDSDEDEDEEGRSSWGKKPKTSSEGEGEVKSEDELLDKPVKKKRRVKTTPMRTDSCHPKHKQRNSNPGRRRVGGRIYDSVLGKTCHWCRQKTVELHVECTLCPIRFCGPCLQNRNGENADLEILFRWICPKCRGGCGSGCKNCCNCGPCRKSQGFGPTGQLINVARKFGFSDVHDYLVHQKTKESPEDIAARKKGRKWSRDSGARFRKSVLKNTVKEEEEENEMAEEAELYGARAKVVTSSDDEEEEENNEAEEAELSSARATSSDDDGGGKDEVVEKAELKSAQAKVKAEPVNIYEEPRKRKTFDGPRMEKISADPRASSSDRAFDISGSKSRKTDIPVQTCISEDPSDDIWLSQSSCETVSRGNSTTEGSDFAKELESALLRPFSTHQFKEMWEHIKYRKRVMILRQTRRRSIEVPGNADGLSYLDHYPDLAEKLARSQSPEEKLRLLRGFFFWIQRSCSEGAYRPWRDSPVVDDSGDCTEISGPDCEIIRVLLGIDEDEDKETPEWEDKKPVIKLAEDCDKAEDKKPVIKLAEDCDKACNLSEKKLLSEKEPVPRSPVKVKVEKVGFRVPRTLNPKLPEFEMGPSVECKFDVLARLL